MSKVYSFRFCNDDPREVQAMEAIEGWVGKGYSLRYMVVEAILAHRKEGLKQDDLNSVVEQLQDLILPLDKQPVIQPSKSFLSDTFLDAVRKSVWNDKDLSLSKQVLRDNLGRYLISEVCTGIITSMVSLIPTEHLL
jgi:hypothetical protein